MRINNYVVVDIIDEQLLPAGLLKNSELNCERSNGLLQHNKLLEQVCEAIDLHPELTQAGKEGSLKVWRCLRSTITGYLRLSRYDQPEVSLASMVLCSTPSSASRSKLAAVRWYTDLGAEFVPVNPAVKELVGYLNISLYRELESFWQEAGSLGYYLINALALRGNLGRLRDVKFDPNTGISSISASDRRLHSLPEAL